MRTTVEAIHVCTPHCLTHAKYRAGGLEDYRLHIGTGALEEVESRDRGVILVESLIDACCVTLCMPAIF